MVISRSCAKKGKEEDEEARLQWEWESGTGSNRRHSQNFTESAGGCAAEKVVDMQRSPQVNAHALVMPAAYRFRAHRPLLLDHEGVEWTQWAILLWADLRHVAAKKKQTHVARAFV